MPDECPVCKNMPDDVTEDTKEIGLAPVCEIGELKAGDHFMFQGDYARGGSLVHRVMGTRNISKEVASAPVTGAPTVYSHKKCQVRRVLGNVAEQLITEITKPENADVLEKIEAANEEIFKNTVREKRKVERHIVGDTMYETEVPAEEKKVDDRRAVCTDCGWRGPILEALSRGSYICPHCESRKLADEKEVDAFNQDELNEVAAEAKQLEPNVGPMATFLASSPTAIKWVCNQCGHKFHAQKWTTTMCPKCEAKWDTAHYSPRNVAPEHPRNELAGRMAMEAVAKLARAMGDPVVSFKAVEGPAMATVDLCIEKYIKPAKGWVKS